MRMLWISCLLIGSISCVSAGKKYGSGAAGSGAADPGFWRSVRYNSPVVSSYGAAYPASQPSGYDSGALGGGYGYGGYASSGSGYAGDASYAFVTSSGDESPEPVFSDVSDLEPVYAFNSRSRYQRGRAMYTKTRYNPGEPGPVVMSVSGDASKTSNQNYPAKAPAKGCCGFHALLIGSISVPAGKKYGSGAADPGFWRSVRYNSPVVSSYGAAYPASQPSGYDSGALGGGYGYGGGYASSGSGSAGDASYAFVTSSDAGDESPEPVFSDVSDLEPVYAFSSRSRYQQGRAMYTKTRYTPGESGPVVMPVSGATSDASNQNYPAKAPAKGGY
ncbi:prisilkin-39-like [Scomber scombrus]|uniref:prisilkin-39-like n=1 Tax=Scomber scombrus TaxID=13677 RepID=UPI002DD88FA5|nr:prisilkin-39-like [Scomber scombrus]